MSGLETWVCNDIIYSNLDLGQKEREYVCACVRVHVCACARVLRSDSSCPWDAKALRPTNLEPGRKF